MIRGLGVDLCEVERMRRALDNPRFALRVFTPAEQERIQAGGAPTASGLWAAKEAVAKALGTGFAGFTLTDVEIVHNSAGQPQVLLHAGAARRWTQLGGGRLFITITHEKSCAAAVAILEQEESYASDHHARADAAAGECGHGGHRHSFHGPDGAGRPSGG